MIQNCSKCGKNLNESDMIKTDEFKEYGSEVKNYCPDCFLDGVKNYFGNYDPGRCSVCNSNIVLQHDDDEIISQAKFDYTVSFVCEKVKNAVDNNAEKEVERLEQEEHDWFMMYTIQPDPNESDWG